jgi:tRNA(Leu) C34 or U34 (ribose-2'-O)-methylase TrmL
VNDYVKHRQLVHPYSPSYNLPLQGIASAQGDDAGLFIVEPSDTNSESEFLAKAAPEVEYFTQDFETALQQCQETRQHHINTTQEQPAVKPSSNKEFRDTFEFGKELDELEAELLIGAENDTSYIQGQENNSRMQLSTANLQHPECSTISPMQDNYFERPLEIHKQGNNEDTDQLLAAPQKESGTESKRLSLKQIVKRTSAKILKIGTATDEGSDISKNGESQISQWDGSTQEASSPNSPIKRIFNKLQPHKEEIESSEPGEQGHLDNANQGSSKFVSGQNIQ